MHCKSCLKHNDDDAVYCKFCGIRLVQREDQEQLGPGANWFDRVGRRKLLGRRLGAEGAATLLVVVVVSVCGIGAAAAGSIYHLNASERGRIIVDTGKKLTSSSHQTTGQSPPTPTIAAHGGYRPKSFVEPTGHPSIVLFERTAGKIGMCEVWLLRWKIEGASVVRLSREGDPGTENFKAIDHTVLRKAGHYKLEAVGSEEGVETRTFDIPGLRLCDK